MCRKKYLTHFLPRKEWGKVQGLGCPFPFGIIQKHNGKIELFSKPGEGTEFVITIPVNQ
jgi:nitrogen-specific signal transduction histidine kinase